MGTGVSVLSALKKGMQGWIRTAAEPTAACGGNREARLGQRSAFSKPCQGAAEKAASATRKTRRIVRREKAPVQQRRPLPAAETGRSCWGCGQQDARAAQGTMQPLGAATRVPFLRGSRNPPVPTKKPQRIKIRCGFVLRYFALLFLLHPPVRAAGQEYCFAQ